MFVGIAVDRAPGQYIFPTMTIVTSRPGSSRLPVHIRRIARCGAAGYRDIGNWDDFQWIYARDAWLLMLRDKLHDLYQGDINRLTLAMHNGDERPPDNKHEIKRLRRLIENEHGNPAVISLAETALLLDAIRHAMLKILGEEGGRAARPPGRVRLTCCLPAVLPPGRPHWAKKASHRRGPSSPLVYWHLQWPFQR